MGIFGRGLSKNFKTKAYPYPLPKGRELSPLLTSTESPLLTSPLGEEIGTYPYPLPKGRELRSYPLVGGR